MNRLTVVLALSLVTLSGCWNKKESCSTDTCSQTCSDVAQPTVETVETVEVVEMPADAMPTADSADQK